MTLPYEYQKPAFVEPMPLAKNHRHRKYKIAQIENEDDVILAQSLSEREQQVLQMVVNGDDYAEIARVLGMKVRTLRTHMNGIASKWGVSTRHQITKIARRIGIVPTDNVATSMEAMALAQHYLSLAQKLRQEGK